MAFFLSKFASMQPQYSFVIPVFNRPQEIEELLDSMTKLDFNKGFEVVIVEDGSTETSAEVIKRYSETLLITYLVKENTGPGDSRNYGMAGASGNYFLILDSDCLLPVNYLKAVDDFLNQEFVHCLGGADAAHPSFTRLQKAINYTMTSYLTTGGIRGSKKSIQQFEPRSFNMGLSKVAFEKTGGFGDIHPGEDPDLSQRVRKEGFRTAYIPNAYVFHKRRISWKKFYMQVKKFGTVRPILNRWHPNSAKITFWLPSLFVLFSLGSVVFAILWDPIAALALFLYAGMILIDSSVKNNSVLIGILSVMAMFIQFFGYGMAFFRSWILIGLLKKDPRREFPKLFFK